MPGDTHMTPLFDLVSRAQSGDIAAFSEVVERVQDVAIAYGYARLGDRQLAEDVAQEALIEAFRSLSQLRDPRAFMSFFRTLLFKHVDRVQRKKQPPTVALELTPDVAADALDPSQIHEASERRERVRSEVRALPDALRVAVMLFYGAGHSIEAIAEFNEEPVGTIKRRLHDARRLLKERMIDMVKDALEDLRPSRSPDFALRVTRLLAAIAAERRDEISELTASEPELVTAPGQHPLWGGEPLPLQVAAERGHADVVGLLLDRGADPNAQTPGYGGGWTPLHLALHAGHRLTAELLVRRGARVDLCAAATLGDGERVREWLARDEASVLQRGPNGATPLHLAASVEIAKLLLEAGADLAATDSSGNTPERFLVGYPERHVVARFVLEAGGRPADVFLAAALGDVARVRTLVEADRGLLDAKTSPYDGTARLSRGATALHVSALHGQVTVAAALLELGAAIDARSIDGQTALHLAAGAGQIALARLLLERGADLGAVDQQHGGTPLSWAEFHGQKAMANYLTIAAQ
ncbi:MAG TPA: sigma-70 family RNA polymerase sigma factor [Polyangiaceae bacterium]|nr:sigma-70 family RNA polymerase sigma factor [Polyangiaceae bacterium]